MVTIAHDERERSAERAPLPEAGEHLHLVALYLLTRAPAVTLLSPVQVRIDQLPVERQPRREAGQDRDERGSVRFACRRERQCHHAERTAARITSTGAGHAGPELEGGGALGDQHFEAVDEARSRSLGGPCGCRLRIREIDEDLAGGELDENLVALRRGVDDEVGARHIRRPGPLA